MSHVRPDQMASGEGATEGKFACEDRRADYTGKAASIVSGIRRVGAPNAEQIEHGTLRL